MFRLLRKLEGASRLAAAAVLAAAPAAPVLAAAQAPEPAVPAARTAPEAPAGKSVEEQVRDLERQVEELRAEIARLRAEREGGTASETPPAAEPASPPAAEPARIDELERRLDVLAGEIERLELGQTEVRAEAGEHGYGPAASKVYKTSQGLSVGGYGEVLYQGFDSTRDDGSAAGERDTLDLQRAVFYFGYKFTDRWLFNSEVEYEHGAVGEEHDGEVGVEFAYLDYLWRPEASFRAGLVLVPMGFVNELHEPTAFLGARRPDVEDKIIPTTWRENGFGLFGEAGPFSYRTYVINGFDASGFEAEEGLHEGKQDGSRAAAEDFAWVGRLDYGPVPGLLVGASAYLGDAGQGLEDAQGRIGLRTVIYEGHAEWRWRGLELRALGVRAELDDVARLDRALGLTGSESVGDRLGGWYLQAGYNLLAPRGGRRQLIPYARWEELDTQASVPAGFARDPANETRSLTLGLAFKPIDQIVVKADYQDYHNEAGTGLDRVNVALGYIF